jgi:predicted GNAT family N-acyltransferase
MTIEITLAQWPRDKTTLADIRRRVFVEEQAVPEHLEWDGEDDTAQHWLALLDGQPIATARLLCNGHIGRMAVLARGRRRGIGSAILNAIVAHAGQNALREVYLHAQTHALPFYERHGFIAEGPEFIDAGIAHRTMRLILRQQRLLGVDGGRFAAVDRRGVALDLVQQCRRQLRLLSHDLDHELYASHDFAAALTQLARSSRFSEVRLLVVDVRPIVQRGHPLLELQRRPSSNIHIRRADCAPTDIKENYLVADQRGVLCYSLREPEKAWSDYNNRPVAEDYCAQFDELWHRSIDDPELRLLHL